jgi:3'-phosphoadenosine 5'-phosphosulfate sulfotransferase (PAPS reductase)/FAD synthetase
MKILVFFSGGKDSQASLIWAVKKFGLKNLEADFCETWNEHEITYKHISDTIELMGVRGVFLQSKKYTSFQDLAEKKKRFPSTKARFCTEELKTKPIIDYVLDQREHVMIIQGIRRGESLSRSKMLPECTYFKYYFQPYKVDKNGKGVTFTYRRKDVIEWCKTYSADIWRPVFEWSAQEVINYILDNGQKPNPLYSFGFKRVGCFPCIMSGQGEIYTIMHDFPDRWAELKQMELEVGRSFFPPNYIPKRFCQNGEFPMLEDIEKYLNEKRATGDLFKIESEEISCSSHYTGLCE